MVKILVTGDKGFIGHHLKDFLKNKGYDVFGVDILRGESEDLRCYKNALRVTKEIDRVYHLAADVGGIGYLSDKEKSRQIFVNNSIINLNILRACLENNVSKILFPSTSCVYKGGVRKEDEASIEDTENLYGLEKLNAERVFQLFSDKIDIKIIRFQNIYGPECKLVNSMAVADICKNTISAKSNIEVWGDGSQIRNWVYITDCLEFLHKLMESQYNVTVNLGTDNPISIKELAEKIISISGKDLEISYRLDAPTGTKIKSSDNTFRKSLFDWNPRVPLEEGLNKVYSWIELELKNSKS